MERQCIPELPDVVGGPGRADQFEFTEKGRPKLTWIGSFSILGRTNDRMASSRKTTTVLNKSKMAALAVLDERSG